MDENLPGSAASQAPLLVLRPLEGRSLRPGASWDSPGCVSWPSTLPARAISPTQRASDVFRLTTPKFRSRAKTFGSTARTGLKSGNFSVTLKAEPGLLTKRSKPTG